MSLFAFSEVLWLVVLLFLRQRVPHLKQTEQMGGGRMQWDLQWKEEPIPQVVCSSLVEKVGYRSWLDDVDVALLFNFNYVWM